MHFTQVTPVTSVTISLHSESGASLRQRTLIGPQTRPEVADFIVCMHATTQFRPSKPQIGIHSPGSALNWLGSEVPGGPAILTT
jgi:hypothetical protein